MDATSSRDLVAEFCFIMSLVAIDLSRISEEIIAWATVEFGYVQLDDGFSTGSSIMPQKRTQTLQSLLGARRVESSETSPDCLQR